MRNKKSGKREKTHKLSSFIDMKEENKKPWMEQNFVENVKYSEEWNNQNIRIERMEFSSRSWCKFKKFIECFILL